MFDVLQTNRSETPLHLACRKHWPSVVHQLVVAGATLCIVTRQSWAQSRYIMYSLFAGATDVYDAGR